MFGLEKFVLGGTKQIAETTGAYNGLRGITSGLVAGTRVATRMGWRPVEALAVGDEVLTFDHGLQRIIEIRREVVWSAETRCPASLCPLHVPAGALGNMQETWLLPDQNVLVESDAAEDMLGDPFAMVPALALEGFRGIRRVVPTDQVEVISLSFRSDEVVFANIGALFYQPKSSNIVDDVTGATVSDYKLLPLTFARDLIEMMALEDAAIYPAEVDEALLEVAVA